MAQRIARRNDWHRTQAGALTCSIGERGCRVRLFEKTRGGGFHRAVWIAGAGEDRRSMNTTDREEALRLGRMLLAELMKGEVQASPRTPLTLGELWRRYSSECAEYLDNKDRTREGSEASSRILFGYFGKDFRVADLRRDHQRAYEVARQAGGIVFNLKGDVTEKTRARSAEADIGLLHTMLQWATTVRLPSGEFLLERNPLQGVKRIREKNKKQPVATWERYEATVAAMQKLRAESESDDDRLRWVRMEFALFLAERTGKRLGSIRQLRWEDFGVEKQVVSWRAEADKKGYSWQVPMPADFFETVKGFQREIGAVGGYVFATPNTSDGIMDTSQLAKWLRVAEKKAKMPKLDGSLWHAYRRKWAIERKYLPLKDVAAAGGWKDVSTLLEVYQQADEESVLAVTSVTLKLRDRGVA
jgi:integrase